MDRLPPLCAIVLIILTLLSGVHVMNAYAHGVQTGPPGRPVRIDNEQFSANRIDTDGFVTIRGSVTNLSEQQIKLSPYVLVDRADLVSSGDAWRGQVPPYDGLLRVVYPPYRDVSSWYFEVKHNLESPLTLQSGEQVDFEIKAYPLKSGVYHVHSYFVSDNGSFWGRGQTIVVDGSAAPTAGEVYQMYLPFATGLAAAAILIPRAASISRKKAERAVRTFFAAKSSFETVWLSGVLFWLATTSYVLETRSAFVLSALPVLASITLAGYAASIVKSRAHHTKIAVGTSISTAAFHFILTFSNTLDQYRAPQFTIDPLVSFVIIVASALAAAYLIAMLGKERGRVSQTDRLAQS